MAINKELDLRFVLCYTPLEFRDTLHALADGKVDASALVTGTVGLDGVAERLRRPRRPRGHAKILIDPASSAAAARLASASWPAARPSTTCTRSPAAMPGANRYPDRDRAVYQVGGRSFVFFRTPRPDAVDPETGERYDDVIVFWVESEEDKQALVLDESTPFFSTPHFDGHPSVLLRGSRIGELSLEELTEVVQDAWLARAGKRARAAWLAEHPPG